MDKWLTENYLCCGACEVWFPLHKNAWPAYTRASHMNCIDTTAATVGRFKFEFRMPYKLCRRKENQSASVNNFAKYNVPVKITFVA